MAASTGEVVIFEDESLRDGLQMESKVLGLEEKLACFTLLKQAGIPRIEVGSFVHPRILPQMADTDELIRRIGKQSDTIVTALVLNGKGLDRALACAVPHVNLSVSVSNEHSMKNTGMTAKSALTAICELIRRAQASGLGVRAGLQCVFGCVYQGMIPEREIFSALERLAATGVQEINLADTTGMATPEAIRRIVGRVHREFPQIELSLHLHDTRGMGMVNLFAGYEAGVRIFDVCAGGLGGCPFIKGASGNVAAEDAVNMFESMGISTGVDLDTLCQAVSRYTACLGRPLPGRMGQVIHFTPHCS